jgi:mannose-6-phosphate isomerase
MFYPLKFQPLPVERPWGGQRLARFGKVLPAHKPIGETWEISDRDDAQSRLLNGPLAGRTLRQLIAEFGDRLLGTRVTGPRFPLLVKMLDARETLSLQVHPPAAVAARLGGEPKTEMWYVLDADPDARLFAGLKQGVSRAQLEKAIAGSGEAVAACVHQFPVRAGDTVFVPAGRLHAIGGGLVIIEIQQSSDTTYRVYDWNRGRPLQISESLASIDFEDFEPSPTPLPIVCEHFRVEKRIVSAPVTGCCDGTTFQILAGVDGALNVNGETLQAGEFVLLPATLGDYQVSGRGAFLQVTVPPGR